MLNLPLRCFTVPCLQRPGPAHGPARPRPLRRASPEPPPDRRGTPRRRLAAALPAALLRGGGRRRLGDSRPAGDAGGSDAEGAGVAPRKACEWCLVWCIGYSAYGVSDSVFAPSAGSTH